MIMTLLGTLCGFGLLNTEAFPADPDQPTGTREGATVRTLNARPHWTLSRRSDPAEQKQNEKDHEDDADNPNSTKAVTVSTEVRTHWQ
jgi:hypothetical protein